MKKLPLWLGHLVAAILSLAAGFFGVMLVLFADVANREKIGAFTYVLVAYVVISSFLHWLWPGRGRTWNVWLIIPALVFAVYIILADQPSHLLYPLSIIIAAVGGTLFGGSILNRKKNNGPRPPATPS